MSRADYSWTVRSDRIHTVLASFNPMRPDRLCQPRAVILALFPLCLPPSSGTDQISIGMGRQASPIEIPTLRLCISKDVAKMICLVVDQCVSLASRSRRN